MATLDGTLVDLQAAYNELEAFAASHGIAMRVADFGGVRTEADTARILAFRDDDFRATYPGRTPTADTLQRFRPIAPFGQSFHNYGAAFDVAIVARPSGMTADDALKLLGSYAPTIGLRWGGRFSNPDAPHFELAIPLSEAQARYDDVAAGRDGGDLGGGDTPTAGTNDTGAVSVGFGVALAVVAGVVMWALRRRFS